MKTEILLVLGIILTCIASAASAKNFDCEHFVQVELQVNHAAAVVNHAMLRKPHDHGDWMAENGRIQGVLEVLSRLQAECYVPAAIEY